MNSSRLLLSSSSLLRSSFSRPTGLRSFLRVIQQGTEAYRTFLGQNPTRLKPGLRLNLPIVHLTRVVDMREGAIPIPHLNAFTKDNVPVYIAGSLFYQVKNSYNACFGVQDYLDAVTNLGTSAARSVIGMFDYDDIIRDRNKINTALRTVIESQSEAWGVTCTRFEIGDFQPSNENIKQQLELAMKAERERRENDLKAQASVRTAVADKDSKIQKSLGELEAAKNLAEAKRIQAIKEGEGGKEKIRLEAEAKAEEIRLVAAAFGGNAQLAHDYLIEKERIRQLEALARSGSGTWVVPAEINKLLTRVSGMFSPQKTL